MGIGAAVLHILQALALVALGIHFFNKATEKISLIFNTIVSFTAIGFVLFLRNSTEIDAVAMMEYDYWMNLNDVINYGTGTSILYIVLMAVSFWSFFSEDVLGIQAAHIATYALLTLGLIMCAVHRCKGKYSVAGAVIPKKGFFRLVFLMIIASLIMIPVSFALNDTSGSKIGQDVQECQFCDEEFEDGKNKKYISRTNMCRNCYINYCALTGKELENYD